MNLIPSFPIQTRAFPPRINMSSVPLRVFSQNSSFSFSLPGFSPIAYVSPLSPGPSPSFILYFPYFRNIVLSPSSSDFKTPFSFPCWSEPLPPSLNRVSYPLRRILLSIASALRRHYVPVRHPRDSPLGLTFFRVLISNIPSNAQAPGSHRTLPGFYHVLGYHIFSASLDIVFWDLFDLRKNVTSTFPFFLTP